MIRESFMDRLRYFNKHVTNPIMKTFAGRRVYAIVHHAGRFSGKCYTTPVLAMPVQDGFVIPLPYGEQVDWYQNVQAAGSCELEWQGKLFQVYKPQLIEPDQALPAFPGWVRRMLRRTEVYLKVVRSPANGIVADSVASA